MKNKVDLTYLSLGAGVQSTALLIMSNKGLHNCPRADVAIFADTQCEPKWVYDQVEQLEAWSDIPIVRVTAGGMVQDTIDRNEGRAVRCAAIPSWTKSGNQAVPLRRQCTREYKIDPIEKYLRGALGYKKRQHVKKKALGLIGISWDEANRAKQARTKWTELKFPLLDAHLKRHDRVEIIQAEGFGVPGKSSCSVCPFHSDDFWARLRSDDPDSFERACNFDEAIRDCTRAGVLRPTYLHRSCNPLRDVVFGNGQLTFDWAYECEGICGT